MYSFSHLILVTLLTHPQKLSISNPLSDPATVISQGAGGSDWITAGTEPNLKLERAILRESENYSHVVSLTGNIAKYKYAHVDLNDDGIPETIVHLVGRYFCGTGGCSTFIFKQVRGNYQLISSIGISHPPIIVLDQKTRGWYDLILYTRNSIPMLVQFESGGYDYQRNLDASTQFSGRFLFSRESRESLVPEFPLNP